MVEKPEDTVWIGLEYFCAEGDEFWNMTDEECIAFAKDELVRMEVIKADAVLDAHIGFSSRKSEKSISGIF